MTIYTIEVPDGRTLEIEADNEKAALAGAQQWYSVNAMSKEETEARKTLSAIGEDGESNWSKAKTFVKEAANTAFLNLPRNAEAGVDYLWDKVDGGDSKSFADHYDNIRKVDEARATLNPVTAGLGTGLGIAGPIAATIFSGGTAAPATAPALASTGARLAGMGLRAAKAGAVGAATGAADEFFRQGISSNNRDWGRVAGSGAIGGTIGVVASPIAEKVGSMVASRVKPQAVIDDRGNITPEVLSKLREAGIDPASFGSELADAFKKKGASEATARELLAKKFNIDLSLGQSTDDFARQQFENIGARNGYGTDGQRAGEAFFTNQRAQVVAARDNIGQQLGRAVDADGNPMNLVNSPSEAAQSVIDGIRSRAQAAKAQVDNLYSDALSREGEFVGSAFDGIGGRIKKSLEGDVEIDDVLTPAASRAIKMLDGLRKVDEGTDVIANLSLKEAEQVRKRLNAFRNAASNNPTDRRAISTIIDRFDNHLEDSISNSLFYGDEKALDALRTAREAYRKYRQTFSKQGAGDDVGALMRKISDPDLNITSNEVANALFGVSKIGEKGVSQRLAARLRTTLGADSQEWNAIRQGIWQKLTTKPEGVDDFGEQALSQRIANFVNGDGSALAKIVYTPEELRLMKDFSTVLKSTTPKRVRGGSSNPNSDTAPAIGSMVAKVWEKADKISNLLGYVPGLGVANLVVRHGLKMTKGHMDAEALRKSLAGVPELPPLKAPPTLWRPNPVALGATSGLLGGVIGDKGNPR